MCQPLQILHVIAKLDGYGASSQLRVLVDHQLATGHQVQVLALTAERGVLASWQEQGVDCYVLALRWRFDPFVAWRLARTLRRNRYDLIHTWDRVAHRYCRAVRPANSPPCLHTCLHTCLHPKNAPGVSRPLGHGSREQFLQELALPADAQLIALAGQLTREKRVDEAIWSFELVRTISPSAYLLIMGDGPDRPRLERFARLASESSAIRFLGYRSDLGELLPLVDVFWQTGESMLAGFEAMAAQIPLVATDTAASRAALQDAETGYLVACSDRAAWARITLKLLQDKNLAREIGLAGAKQIAAQFSVTTMTQKYAVLYDQALETAATRENAVGSIPTNH